MYARPFIDSLDFARNGRKISGEVQIAELARILDGLENPRGILSYIVQGGGDKQDTLFLDVHVVGQCSMRCQRCLNGLDYPILIDSRLLLRDQSEMDVLEDKVAGGEDEEFDSILANAHLDVLDMLEEEILLSLPIAPKHELGACQVTNGENSHREEKNPFAVLAKLKSS